MSIKNTGKNWFALIITADPAASEAIEFALNELDSIGTQMDSLGNAKDAEIEIIGYFDEKPSDDIVADQLTEALRIYGFSRDAIRKTSWRVVKERDWLAEWKKYWKPTVTGSFIVAPPWEKIENPDKVVIRIEPNMAFGTGTHETTRLCLQAIEEHYHPGMSFLDVGTGTGILAIAAAKFARDKSSYKDGQDSSTGFSRVAASAQIMGCDTDEDSVRIARENAILNGSEGIEFFVGSISEKTPPFDFICANLTADVILPLLPLLVQKAGKILVLSGILVEQETSVTEELQALGVKDYSVSADGEWIGIIVAHMAA